MALKVGGYGLHRASFHKIYNDMEAENGFKRFTKKPCWQFLLYKAKVFYSYQGEIFEEKGRSLEKNISRNKSC